MLFVGVLIGYISVQRLMDSRTEAAAGSGWVTWQERTPDPYSVARYLKEGMLPADSAQWTVYETNRDSAGWRIDADCVYSIKGRMPASRWWRLSAEGPGGSEQALHKSWLQSDGTVFESDGSVRILLSPSPRPANWIMPPDASGLRLLLFVLEERRQDRIAPPPVERISCP